MPIALAGDTGPWGTAYFDGGWDDTGRILDRTGTKGQTNGDH